MIWQFKMISFLQQKLEKWPWNTIMGKWVQHWMWNSLFHMHMCVHLVSTLKFNVGDHWQSDEDNCRPQQTTVFQQWFTFENAQSDILEIEVWDEDGGLNGKDNLMGKCQIQLYKSVSDKKCSFENGEVLLWYMCL